MIFVYDFFEFCFQFLLDKKFSCEKLNFLKGFLENFFKGYFLAKIKSYFTCAAPKWHKNMKNLESHMIMAVDVLITINGDLTDTFVHYKEKKQMGFLKLE